MGSRFTTTPLWQRIASQGCVLCNAEAHCAVLVCLSGRVATLKHSAALLKLFLPHQALQFKTHTHTHAHTRTHTHTLSLSLVQESARRKTAVRDFLVNIIDTYADLSLATSTDSDGSQDPKLQERFAAIVQLVVESCLAIAAK